MKISLSAPTLKRLLGQVLTLGTGDATHPGFSLMHLETTKKGALRATVVNSQAAVRMVHVLDGENFEPGAAAVSLRSMDLVASALPGDDQTASLTLVDSGPGRAPIMRIKCDDLLLKFPTQSLDNIVSFPTLPEGDLPWCQVSGEKLQAIVKHCLWCVAPATDARPALQGVHMTPTQIEAADGHRLVSLGIEGVVNADVIAPAPMISVMAQLAGDGDVRVVCDKGRMWAQGRGFVLTCRLLDGTYPATAPLYMAPDDQGMVRSATSANGAMVRCSEAQLSQPSMWSAATTMTKIFGGGGKDHRPVLKFMIRDGEMTVFMKNETGVGIDMAQKISWSPGEKLVPDDAAIGELNALLVDAQYVSQVVGALPKQERMQMLWTSARDRIQLSAGNVKAVIMPRGG